MMLHTYHLVWQEIFMSFPANSNILEEKAVGELFDKHNFLTSPGSTP